MLIQNTGNKELFLEKKKKQVTLGLKEKRGFNRLGKIWTGFVQLAFEMHLKDFINSRRIC